MTLCVGGGGVVGWLASSDGSENAGKDDAVVYQARLSRYIRWRKREIIVRNQYRFRHRTPALHPLHQSTAQHSCLILARPASLTVSIGSEISSKAA